MLSWRRFRATCATWWRLMRMQRVTREGWFYVGTTLVIGAAAINTGNNLLYLVLGLQIALLLLSAVLSEWALQGVKIERVLPSHGVAGRRVEVRLRLHNRKRRISSHSLRVQELSLPDAMTWIGRLPPQATMERSYRLTSPHRGVIPFQALRITTRFPFGFFEKSREVELPGQLVVHPAGTRKLPPPHLPVRAQGELPQPLPGSGMEFYALRDFRPGDDPRHVHWRSTARAGKMLVVERERERRRRVSLLADTRGLSDEAVDALADAAVAWARRLIAEGCEVGLSWPGGSLPPAAGREQLFYLGDAAARLVGAGPEAPPPLANGDADPIELPRGAGEARGAMRAEAVVQREERGGRFTLSRTQRFLLFAAACSAFAALASSGELPLWVGALFVGAAVGGSYLRERTSQRARRWTNGLLLSALVVFFWLVWQGVGDVMILAPSFATLIAAARLLVRQGPLDDPLILLSALLMLSGGAALSGDLIFGVFYGLFAVLGTLALATTQLRRELEATGGRPAAELRGSVSGALLASLGVLSVCVLVASVALFLVFPRVRTGVALPVPQAQAGDSGDRIELGGIGVLKDDPTPLARVRFPNPPPSEIYWRTRTFSTWDGRAWLLSGHGREPVRGSGGFYPLRGNTRGTFEAEVELLRETETLPIPGKAISLRLHRRPGMQMPTLLGAADGTLAVEGAPLPFRYTVRASASIPDASDPGSAIVRDLVLPHVDHRIEELARSFTSTDPEALAEEIRSWLIREYRYTRQLPGEVDDPLAHFLFERREGHCEYFATALAVLLRLRDIPARVVAGYYGASWVPAGSYWVVREGDAHAWTEAWIPGKGWMHLDATPPGERQGVAEGAWARMVGLMDLLRMHWTNWVLDFDGRKQRHLAAQVASAFGDRRRAPGESVPLGELWVASAVAFGIAGGWLALRILRNLPAGRRLRFERPGEATRLYRAIKRSLRQRGVSLPAHASSTAWAEAARRALGEAARPYEAAIATYESARFGGRPLGRQQARVLRRSLEKGKR